VARSSKDTDLDDVSFSVNGGNELSSFFSYYIWYVNHPAISDNISNVFTKGFFSAVFFLGSLPSAGDGLPRAFFIVAGILTIIDTTWSNFNWVRVVFRVRKLSSAICGTLAVAVFSPFILVGALPYTIIGGLIFIVKAVFIPLNQVRQHNNRQ
jgi:hypothetical protein